MPVEKSAGAVIFRKKDSEFLYLLLHYPSRQAKRGARRDETKFQRTSGSRTQKEYWDLPKGHIEKGEKLEDTVKREVKEETGLEDIKFIEGFKETIKYFFKWEGKNILKFVTYYLIETKTKKVKISWEHIGYKWLPCEEAIAKLTFKNAKEILEEANNFLKK